MYSKTDHTIHQSKMKTLIWQGIIYQSLEYFNIQEDDKNYTVTSKIIGCYQDKMYTVDYQLILNKDWTMLDFLIESEVNTIKTKITGKKQQDHWEINDLIHPDLKGFKYIDISLTPFTNTLPINNLTLTENHPQKIEVIYIDILNNHIKPAKQQYTQTSPTGYLYENIETDFKANILVDEDGLVIHYPGLFKKIAELT